MTKIDITRTELVWPGKYYQVGNLVTPLAGEPAVPGDRARQRDPRHPL